MLEPNKMMNRMMGAACLVLAVGCVEPEAPELGEMAEASTLEPCPGCGGNGLPQGQWDYVFSTLDHNALNDSTNAALDLWDDATASPMSLCKPGTVSGTSCRVRDGWSAWVDKTPSARRVGILTHLVQIVLPKGYRVVDPDGYTYHGKFGLMFWARESSWGQAGREIASAGLLALLNSVPDIPICLNTPQLPNNCSGSSARYSESIAFGDAIFGLPRFIAISGGVHAKDPRENDRYGTVFPTSASALHYDLNHCLTSGAGNLRYPISCAYNGHTWTNPVHVLVPELPSSWYYGAPSPDEYHPEKWPQPI